MKEREVINEVQEQIQNEEEQDHTTGKFGTGFITTYLLSRVSFACFKT